MSATLRASKAGFSFIRKKAKEGTPGKRIPGIFGEGNLRVLQN
jgi:hypothetical protein